MVTQSDYEEREGILSFCDVGQVLDTGQEWRYNQRVMENRNPSAQFVFCFMIAGSP